MECGGKGWRRGERVSGGEEGGGKGQGGGYRFGAQARGMNLRAVHAQRTPNARRARERPCGRPAHLERHKQLREEVAGRVLEAEGVEHREAEDDLFTIGPGVECFCYGWWGPQLACLVVWCRRGVNEE